MTLALKLLRSEKGSTYWRGSLFLGTVRDMNDSSQVKGMTLEHYPGMTEKALQEILDQAKERWDIYQALVIHRVGLAARGSNCAGGCN